MSIGLDIEAHIGYSNDKYNETYWGPENDEAFWHDWSASVGVPISLGVGFSVTPAYLYSSLMDGDVRDMLDETEDPEFDPDNGLFMVTVSWAGEV